jgi:hypothetical protein
MAHHGTATRTGDAPEAIAEGERSVPKRTDLFVSSARVSNSRGGPSNAEARQSMLYAAGPASPVLGSAVMN